MTRRRLVAPRSGELLSNWTSFRLGGPAQYFVEAHTREELEESLRWAEQESTPVHILGGGSNLVVADRGVRGLVIRIATSGVDLVEDGDGIQLKVAAGADWDEVVAESVEAGLTGLECLSGIPGTVGATPIQNVGAYGAEVSDFIETVRVIDRNDGSCQQRTAEECGFGYRTSVFRRNPGRFVVIDVEFRLRRGGRPHIRYPELERAVSSRSAEPTPAEVRDVVLDLRRSKGMVLDEDLPGSAGSYFVNPILDGSALRRVERVVGRTQTMPRFEVGDDRFKVPAAWLIENAGFERGRRFGPVGVSEHHALALVHHRGGSTADLVDLATRIQARVAELFGVELQPEPVFWGFPDEPSKKV